MASSTVQLLALALSILLAAQCEALIGRQSREFPSRFFIPDSLLVNQLLSHQPQQLAPFAPVGIHQHPGLRAGIFKRYFDSLAGQSLGKRSDPEMAAGGDEER